MRLEKEAYRQRLREYSDSTIQLIIDADCTSVAISLKASEITTNSELTEEQVVAQLKELLKEHGARERSKFS